MVKAGNKKTDRIGGVIETAEGCQNRGKRSSIYGKEKVQ